MNQNSSLRNGRKNPVKGGKYRKSVSLRENSNLSLLSLGGMTIWWQSNSKQLRNLKHKIFKKRLLTEARVTGNNPSKRISRPKMYKANTSGPKAEGIKRYAQEEV